MKGLPCLHRAGEKEVALALEALAHGHPDVALHQLGQLGGGEGRPPGQLDEPGFLIVVRGCGVIWNDLRGGGGGGFGGGEVEDLAGVLAEGLHEVVELFELGKSWIGLKEHFQFFFWTLLV